jgi:C4-type Zn-finger protein
MENREILLECPKCDEATLSWTNDLDSIDNKHLTIVVVCGNCGYRYLEKYVFVRNIKLDSYDN